jgi:hypothetical protein
MALAASCRTCLSACRSGAARACGTITFKAPAPRFLEHTKIPIVKPRPHRADNCGSMGPEQRKALSEQPHTWLANAGSFGGVPGPVLIRRWGDVATVSAWSPPRSRHLPRRSVAGAIAESFAGDCHVADAGSHIHWKSGGRADQRDAKCAIHGDLGQSGACRWAAAAWPGGTRTTLEPRPTGGANQRKGPGPHEGLGSSRKNQRLATSARSQLRQLGNQAGKAPAQGGNEQEPGSARLGPSSPTLG